MEISSKIPSVHRTPEGQPPSGRVKTTTPVQPAPKGDRVQLSTQAKEMLAARQAIQRMPDVDLEKVADIKAQLKDGRYQADARKIASKMMMESLLNDTEK